MQFYTENEKNRKLFNYRLLTSTRDIASYKSYIRCRHKTSL